MREVVRTEEPAPFKYRWRRLGSDGKECFGGTDGKLSIGWFELITSGDFKGDWNWHFGDIAYSLGQRGRMSGTARDIAHHIEALYDHALPLSSGVGLNLPDQLEHYRLRGIPVPAPVNHAVMRHRYGLEFKIVGVFSGLW